MEFSGTLFFAVVSLSLALAQTEPPHTGWVFQAAPGKDGVGIVVIDRSGAVITDANVKLLDSTGNVLVDAITNEYGRVQVAKLAAGKFNVQVDDKQFKPTETSLDIPQQLGSTIVLTLEPLARVIYQEGPHQLRLLQIQYAIDYGLPIISRTAYVFPFPAALPPPAQRCLR